LIVNKKTLFHASSYALKTPASPHYAAFLDEIEIDVNQINVPKTENHLVID
jgi:dethiobiotin synthetase